MDSIIIFYHTFNSTVVLASILYIFVFKNDKNCTEGMGVYYWKKLKSATASLDQAWPVRAKSPELGLGVRISPRYSDFFTTIAQQFSVTKGRYDVQGYDVSS